ncbi:MAG: hypothetical protein ACRDNP_15120, partial [Gaiellaceae bacterium]
MIRIRPIRLLVVAVQASARMNVPRTLPLALATLAAGALALLPAPASATRSGLAPEALTRARMIRAEVNARYRLVPGRKLVVTEATTTGGCPD